MKLYEDICGYFEKAVNLRIGKNMQDGFSPIFLLDIYLNAFLKYASGFKKPKRTGIQPAGKHTTATISVRNGKTACATP